MRVLITGATGFIGQHLVTHLIQQPGTAVCLLLREPYAAATARLPPSLAVIRPQVDVVYADLRNFQLTVRAVRQSKPDVVFHLAAAGTTTPFLPPETALRHNVQGTINLLRACFEKTNTVRQLITTRTSGEPHHMNPYTASKAAAWYFCAMYGQSQQWPILGATIFQAYGPGQSTRALVPAAMQAAFKGEDFPMTNGQQARDWIYVSDIIAGLSRLLTANLPPATTIELGSGQATSIAAVVQLIYDLVGHGGRPLVGVLPQRPGEVAEQIAQADKTKALIGWNTAVSLRAGLTQLLAHYSSRSKT